ncbi:MAG TPA: twin-arginine translocase TatA/TatE family subunit [Allosphingosinicella sp.]|nr:twin-arginine translocase TatA/TatE family subunit [Allosphingosinicella sp.]
MGGFSLWHWLVVGVIILLLFGKGRFSEMMGDVAKGLKSFKKGMTEEEEAAAPPPRRLEAERSADAAPDRSRTGESEERREP